MKITEVWSKKNLTEEEIKWFKAVEKRDYNKVIMLLFNNKDLLNVKDEFGTTALHLAVLYNYFNITQLLLSKKDLSITTHYETRLTPFQMALLNRNSIIIEIFLKSGKMNFSNIDLEGKTELHRAIINKEVLLAEALTKVIDINVGDNNGITPLHESIISTDIEITMILLSKPGINVNARDKDNNTPLHYATLYNRKKIANLLINKGANINAKNKFGETALLIAMKNDYKQFVEFLFICMENIQEFSSKPNMIFNRKRTRGNKNTTIPISFKWQKKENQDQQETSILNQLPQRSNYIIRSKNLVRIKTQLL